MGDVWMVVRVPEKDARTLLYAPEGEQQITVTEEQDVAWLEVGDLNRLNLWSEARAMAEQQRQPKPERCRRGVGCLRADRHPPLDDDGVGHSKAARYRGL